MKHNPETEKSIRFPTAYLCVWLLCLVYWEFLLRICIRGAILPDNLTLLVFLPAEAFFLTALSGFFDRRRFLCGLLNILPALVLFFYYSSQLVYFRVAGSLLPVGMLGAGDQAVEDFGWTIRGEIIRSLPIVFLFLIPVFFIGLFSLTGGHRPDPDEKREPLLKGYTLWLRPVCLLLAVLCWLAAGLSLSLFGRERDSAWYVYHSTLSDTDTSAERIGALTTTVVELFIYRFGGAQDLTETVNTSVDLDALTLSDGAGSVPKTTGKVVFEELPAKQETKEDKEADTEEPAQEEPPRIRENEAFDFTRLANAADNENTRVLCEYFASRKPTATNEMTGLFEGYNLICLCGESFATYGIDPQITPTLYQMANNGIVLDHFYNSFPNITTNGEYAFCTSLWPDVSRKASNGSVAGSFAQSASTFMPYGLGDLFSAAGVNSYAYHNYRGDYYMRDYSWPNLGYPEANMKFLGRGMSFTSAWPASDLEMMEQSVDDYIAEDSFHAYYMTFSGHGPYDATNYMFRKNIDRVRELAGGRYQSEQCLGYFCGEYELELALAYLCKRLEEAGKLDKTVFVLIGDHFPYYLSDEAVKEFAGGALPDSMERFHSTCIIYNAGMKEPVHSDVYCCNVDILPTILNLFDLDFDSRLLMGTDIFADGIHRVRLYNGSFLTDVVCYDRTSGRAVWNAEADHATEEEKKAYLDAMLDYTENEYAVSLGMLDNDFYFHVWKNAGLLNEEEAKAEKARQEKGQSVYRIREEEERIKAEEAEAAKAQEAEQQKDGEAGAPAGEAGAPAGEAGAPAGEAGAPAGEAAAPAGQGAAQTGEAAAPAGQGAAQTGEAAAPAGQGTAQTGEQTAQPGTGGQTPQTKTGE